MNRHFYISDSLDELEALEGELEARGIGTEQIHVLSENDAELERHHLHEVSPVMKQDLMHAGKIGSLIGLALAALVILAAWLNDWSESAAGWIPFIFLAGALAGFSIWEGSLFGLQKPNSTFQRFAHNLHEGKHLFFVDVSPGQESVLNQVVTYHPRLQWAGTGNATPNWAMTIQRRWHQLRTMF